MTLFEAEHKFDMSAIYAKLELYCLQREHFASLGLEPVIANGIPEPAVGAAAAAPNFNYVDLMADINVLPNAISCPINAAIRCGNIVLERGVDIMETELMVIPLLTAEGRRMTGPAAGVHTHASAINFPSIPVSMIGRGAAPGWAADAAPPSVETVREVMNRLSHNRHEWADYCKGIYLAQEMMGIRYSQRAAVAPGRLWAHTKLDQSATPFVVPRPVDLNIIRRRMGLWPTGSPTREDSNPEIVAWTSMPALQRVHSLARLGAMLLTAFSTVLIALGVTNALLTSFCQQGAVDFIPPAFKELMTTAWCRRNVTKELKTRPPALIIAARRLVVSLYQVNTMWNIWGQQDWTPPTRSLPNAVDAYTGLGVSGVPRRIPLLATWGDLAAVPQEWSMPTTGTSVGLATDSRLFQGPMEQRGVWSLQGDASIRELCKSKSPYNYHSYPALVVNVLSMQAGLEAAPPLSSQPIACVHKIDTGHQAPAAYAAENFEFDAELHVLVPGSYVLYAWAEETYHPLGLPSARMPAAVTAAALQFQVNQVAHHIGLNLMPVMIMVQDLGMGGIPDIPEDPP
jgi:hypothetical protein